MGVDARIQVYDKIHGELVAEGMTQAQATREIAIRFSDVNAGRNAAVTEQAQARVVGRFDGGRARVDAHVSGTGNAPVQAPSISRTASASTASTAEATGDPEGEFNARVEGFVKAGQPKAAAIRRVIVEDPQLHARMLAYNARNGRVSNFQEDKRRMLAAG